jgi:hypothetical protein
MLEFVIRKGLFALLLATWGFGHMAAGQNADDYRGGWRTDKGEAHTYELGQGYLLYVLRRCDDAGLCRWQVRNGWRYFRSNTRKC